MTFKDNLPVSYLLFTNRDRINRLTYWTVSVFIWTSFYILFYLLSLISITATWCIYPILFWALIATATKRLHDINKWGFWILLVFLPVFGVFYLIYLLGFQKGNKSTNRYGRFPGSTPDYYKNDNGLVREYVKTNARIINDVTQLNPILVEEVVIPTSIEELQGIIKNAKMISIGGGRFSMGGQTASSGTIHVDMRQLNKIISFSAEEKTIEVQAGIRWCDIQKFVDEHNLSVKIMQTYANFTVGGSLSVNCHGRYIGAGAVILSVKSIQVILANGELLKCSQNSNSELFFACIGCYNAVGVIATVEFELADNIPVKRIFKKLKVEKYQDFFSKKVRDNKKIIFHNGDIYPPQYKNVRAVSWEISDKEPTDKTRLTPLAEAYPLERYFINAFSRNNFGKWRREYIIDPLIYRSKKIHWRNYEAGYDVLELEPNSRRKSTYVLQEYFIPVENFDTFTTLMREIFQRHNVNVINVSIRHAQKDPGSLMAWAKEEVFAFVIWYKQFTNDIEKGKVAVWTRELIDASISQNGSYYLPYQVHATNEQFLKAYPNSIKLFELKSKLDPNYKFRNILWETYYKKQTMTKPSEFKTIFSNVTWSDKFYQFLQVIFHLYPEDKFHHLIAKISKEKSTDEEIYKTIQSELPKIKPFLSELTMALPALKKQKKEMSNQVLQLLGSKTNINGYLEIGSTGRYISELRKHISLSGNVYLTNDIVPNNSIADIMERGQISKMGTFFLLDYEPIAEIQIPDESLDLINCQIGLHHCPIEKLDEYIKSIKRALRKDGLFIIRDHDVKTPEMATFVSLVHTRFNLGLNETWEKDNSEFKAFKSIDEWSKLISSYGFQENGMRILQDKDPSDNTLLSFRKL